MDALYPKNNYIFVSYAHKDAAKVLPLIDALRQSGFSVWYDQGIEAGTEWPEYIAKSIENCGVFLACISPASMQSNNCRNEINFALSLKKECLTVYLEETKMTAGMQLQLGSLQALFKNRHKTDESFYQSLISANILQHLQRIPAPTQQQKSQEIAPAVSVAKATAQASAEKSAKESKVGTLTIQWLLFCVVLLAVDYTTMWLATSYIENGFLMTIAAAFPALIFGVIHMIRAKKTIDKLPPKEQTGIIENICVFIFLSFVLSTVGDCFLIFCTSKVIFKILISLGINLVRYFVLLACMPDGPKQAK